MGQQTLEFFWHQSIDRREQRRTLVDIDCLTGSVRPQTNAAYAFGVGQ